jgi:hypothetical protein
LFLYFLFFLILKVVRSVCLREWRELSRKQTQPDVVNGTKRKKISAGFLLAASGLGHQHDVLWRLVGVLWRLNV